MTPTTPRPTLAELIEAVREHLTYSGAADAAVPPYLHRVAAGVLSIVERELALGDDVREIEKRECARFGVADSAELAAAIRRGELDEQTGALVPALRSMVDAQLVIDNPKYASPKAQA